MCADKADPVKIQSADFFDAPSEAVSDDAEGGRGPDHTPMTAAAAAAAAATAEAEAEAVEEDATPRCSPQPHAELLPRLTDLLAGITEEKIEDLLPEAVRHRLGLVSPLSSWLRHCLCLVFPLPPRLRHRL